MPHLALVLLDLTHKLLQTLRHAVDTVRQHCHLIIGIRPRPRREISLRNLPSHLRKFLNRLDDTCHDHHRQNHHHHHEKHKQNAAEYREGMYPVIELLCQVFDASRLIIDIRLNVILNQLSHDINIVVKHLDIHIITFLRLQIRLDIVYPIFQCINIAHQDLQPGPALSVCRDLH